MRVEGFCVDFFSSPPPVRARQSSVLGVWKRLRVLKIRFCILITILIIILLFLVLLFFLLIIIIITIFFL